VRGVWRRTPLWLRLISATLVLVALAMLLTGAFGVRLLRGYLVDRVDDQLAGGAQQIDQQLRGMSGMSEPFARRDNDLSVPSQFAAMVLDADGDVQDVRPSELTASNPQLPRLTWDEAVERRGRPYTVDTEDGGGSWRAVARPFEVEGPDGTARGTVVLASSLEEVDATVRRLVQIDVLVGLAVLGGLAVVGYLLVRTALRPLSEIEETAAAIGRGDLARRVPDQDPATEMGRLSGALNAMLEQIEDAFRARTHSEARARGSEQRMRRFVADASHELRTPLTSIRGFAELHRQGAVTDPAEVSQLLARIEGEAERMGVLVEDLLLLARLDQQRPLETAPVGLDDVARDAVEAARAAHPERTIELDAGAVPLVVLGDRTRLHQVLANLLTNALAYSPDDAPVTVRLSAVAAADGGPDRVAMAVEDQGEGLTPEQAERVFERFYRTDPARSRAQGGTGLGLSIVAAIAAAHGGSVEVDTAPGEGSTFRVLLPRAAASAPDAAPGRPAARSPG
jgi:two-component system OmpR family sensor kinase